jgi:hypothetical protein
MGKLFAGAAQCCITPPPVLLEQIVKQEPKYPFEGVYEDIYVRVIVMSDQIRRMAVISVDLNRFPNQQQMCKKLSQTYGIEPLGCIFGCTRNHMAANGTCPEENPPTGKHKNLSNAMKQYIEYVHNATLQAVETAMDTMKPAKIGYTSVKSNINAGRGWSSLAGVSETEDYNAFSDKTLLVMCVKDLEDQPIALFVNYGLRGCMLHGNMQNKTFRYLGGDLPGAISRFVEKASGEHFPVLWTAGAACDQNPMFMSSLSYWVPSQNGEFRKEQYIMPAEASKAMMGKLAAIQGMDILKALQTITEYRDQFEYYAAETCRVISGRVPYHALPDSVEADGKRIAPVKAEDLKLRLRLCVVNGFAFAGLNCEVYSAIGARIRKIIPCDCTAILDASYGHLGCIPDREGEKENKYAVLDSCCYSAEESEAAIEDAFREMSDNYNVWKSVIS